jgi:transcriptional regulator with XRE-family HTH domain
MKSSVAENLGAQLRRTRKSRDLTQPALAARLGRDRARISELERDLIQGRLGRDRLALLLEICDALDLSPVLVPAERLAAVQALLAPAGPKEDAARPDGTAFDDVFIDLADGEA